jgi:Zn-dependent peptidase ImmA (M78 family)/transcriptional regulator with XRE-family HTH domain
MGQPVTGINPEVLLWARRIAGLSVDDVARSLKKRPEDIGEWESGDSAPTYVQLEHLAYRLYHRPVAVFFFPSPPSELKPQDAFRILPESRLRSLDPDTRFAIRKAQAMQLALHELHDGVNPAKTRLVAKTALSPQTNIQAAAAEVRACLGVPLTRQFQWRGAEEALTQWRNALQDSGIYVFKDSIKQREISGFSLTDTEFPIIYLNNSTPFTRQVFSLFHELAHILLDANGITFRDTSFVETLSGVARDIEIFCNAFAAEFLIPNEDFTRFIRYDFTNDAVVDDIAGRYSVSREAVLRRALDRGLVSRRHYEQKAKAWTAEAEAGRRGNGGNYYSTQSAYLGQKFLTLAFQRYYQGRCSRQQLADYLNVKAKNLHGLERFAVAHEAHT